MIYTLNFNDFNDIPLHVFWPSDTESRTKLMYSESVSLFLKRD